MEINMSKSKVINGYKIEAKADLRWENLRRADLALTDWQWAVIEGNLEAIMETMEDDNNWMYKLLVNELVTLTRE